ncbi:MAG: uroporphyrinogen-III C-methyltransferase [Lutibacter sp.]|nr:uroporphyrinogen-III C-methyltransferase [Lutibacter sp.]
MEVAKHPAKVSLVGAGPGDKELMSLKGLKAIEQANVIMYDALVNPEILKYAGAETPCIYVGKRHNNHRYSQDEINRMLVENALEYGHVVRLKGGDSFVFGRGSEEIDYLEFYGVSTEIIPGISSAMAVPASQGIPLTKRGINESFWVITGTTTNGQISEDIALAAQSSATMVVLMGLRKSSQILAEISRHRHRHTPFAIIQNGTLEDESILINTLENYEETIGQIDYTHPGIMVIGDVVSAHPSFLDEAIQRVLHSYC